MNVARFISVVSLAAALLLPMHRMQAQNTKENADFKLAVNLFNDGLYDLAAEQLKQFMNSFPASPNVIEAKFHLGLAQMKLKQYDDARMTFQAFALTYQENPKAPDAWANVGECYASVNNYKEAALAFERVKVFHPKSKIAPEALLKSSTYFSLAGQNEDARRVLRTVLQEFANSTSALPARTLLGKMYFEEGNLVQAQNELKRVIEGDPSPDAKAQALLVLGNISHAMGQLTQAEANYQEIISKHKASTAVQGAYLNLGKLQSGAGKFAEAIENFKKALAEKGVDSSLIFEASAGIAECYVSMDETGSAWTHYEKAVAYAPTPDEAHDMLWKIAVSAARGKNWTRSNDACNRILKPGGSEGLQRKASIRLALNTEERRDFAQAVQHYTSFLEKYPADPVADEIAFRVASLLEKELRSPRKAAAAYEQFIVRYYHAALIDDAYAGAARCYDELKEFDRAAQLYRELLTRFASTEFRQIAEERIRMIDAFEAREKDAGVEKLALLLGDVLGEKDKVGLPYRLGEIYFNELKNYPAAVVQFTNAINSGMSDDRFVHALFYRARSLEYLTWKDKKYIPQAIEAYQTFLRAYPNEARSESATLSLFTLSAASLEAARTAYNVTIETMPEFRRRDALLQQIGLLQEQSDSVQGALSTYGTIVNQYRDSPTLVEATFRRIPLLLTLGLADSALRECISYLNAFPNGPHSAEVTARVADLFSQKGNPERAAEYYRALRDEFSYTTLATAAAAKLADASTESGNYDEAIRVYSELIAAQANNPLSETDVDPALLLSIGRAYQLSGKPGEAKSYLLQVLRGNHSNEVAGAAYNSLGLISMNEGNTELATSYFRQAGTIAPGTGASRTIADLLFDNGSYTDAIKQYALLSQSAENDADRQYYDARGIIARYRNDDLANAGKDQAAFVKKYKNADSDLAAFDLEKGLHYYRKAEYPSARKLFDHIMDKYDDTPSAAFALYWIGKVLESTNKQPEALKLYGQLMKDYPASPVIPRVYLALGNIYYTMEKWDESIRHYKVIIDTPEPDPALLPLAMSNLIETYETAGIFDAALQLTRNYLEKYPNNEDSFDKKIKIGILYQRLGYNDQSVLHLQTLLDQAGGDLEGEIRYYIAEANYNKGDYQQAILDFLKVPYLVTKKGKMDWTANSLYMAGQSYEKLGRFDQSLTMYQQILDRTGIDETFKAAARKEIARVRLVLKKPDSK